MLSPVRTIIHHVKPPTILLRRWHLVSSPNTLFKSQTRPSTISAHLRGEGPPADLNGEERLEDSNAKFGNAYATRRLHSPENVFEELTHEYTKQAKASRKKGKKSQPSQGSGQQVLERLITKGDFGRAGAAKRELSNAGVKMEKNSIYIRAAHHSLERRTVPTHDKLFLEWWSLVPNDAMGPHISFIGTALIQQPVQIDLVTEFFLLCAKAGHSNEIGVQLLPFIFRHLNVESTQRFIRAFHDGARGENRFSRTVLLNLAVCCNFIAERRVEGFELLEQIRKEGLQIGKTTARAISRNHTDDVQRQFLQHKLILPIVPSGRMKQTPPPSAMARDLRLLRQAVKSMYSENMASFAAFFIVAYEHRYRRTRAVQILRKRVFSSGSLPVQSAWVAAEQLAYSRRKLPLPVLRSFLHYCLPAHVPVAKFRELLLRSEKRLDGTSQGRRLDKEHSEAELIPIDAQLWPNVASLSAVWKSAIQLATTREELDELYSAMLFPLEKHRGGADIDPTNSARRPGSKSVIVAELPDAVAFHHFIIAYSTRYGGRRGANVLADMSRLGVKQSMENWTALVGVYARSGDVERVNDILTFLETSFRGSEDSKSVGVSTFRSNMVIAYNSVLRGYTECTMHEEARQVQQRMEDLGYFKDGVEKRTKSVLNRLGKSEKGKLEAHLARKRSWEVKGRKLYIDRWRADWFR